MKPSAFRAHIWKYYRTSGRHTLPWRPPSLKPARLRHSGGLRKDKALNPYHILVSEIMLQQTQVDRVVPKYHSFLKKFPSFEALAAAPLRDVLIEWKGLGYNRRGLNLKRLAEIVVRDYKGKLPRNHISLLELPGIGSYTAGAIRAFAWNESSVFIETNIRTVYIHHFPPKAGRLSIDKVPDSYLLPLIENDVRSVMRGKKSPRFWYYALMDYGAHLKKTVGNLSQKSSTYTKQSKFKGSKRELRSRVLHAISLKKSVLVAVLLENLRIQEDLLAIIIKELIQEGFISVKGKRVSIAV